MISAIRVGLRFVIHTQALQVVLIRGGGFFVFAAATWSLFPLVVRHQLRQGPEIYGLLLTCIGIGAVGGATLLPWVRARVSRDALVASASALYAVAALALAHIQSIALLALAMLATGAAWISILSALQVAAQLTLPAWVRARGLAAFVVIFMGGMATGSVLWGQVAVRLGSAETLTIAAIGTFLAIGLTWRFKLGAHEVLDFTPSLDWPAPVLAEPPAPDQGPVMVTVKYHVRSEQRAEFVAAMNAVQEIRRRNGAYFWQLFHDSADLSRFVELFMDESWLEHLRQHERASVADRTAMLQIRSFLIDPESTETKHWIAERPWR